MTTIGRLGEILENAATDKPTEQDFEHQRDAVRDSLLLQATLRQPGRVSGTVARVRNLSAGGMMVETSVPFVEGDAIESELRGIGRVAGKVAWSEVGKIGVAFDAPIDPKLARKPVGQGPGSPIYAKPADAGTGVRSLKVR